MSMETVVSVKNLSKKYRRFSSVGDAMKEFVHPLRKRYHNEFWALKDVSFEIKKGECVGIIGRNGSGKSTLLQILCGIMQPTGGTLSINGRIAALLELGAGFHPMFTGRDNVYLNGALMGFKKEEMEEKFASIAEFADIGDFIEQPVMMYSSGMFVRLAFSVAIHVDPDILIIDEALAVGDMFFQAKCIQKVKKMIDNGVTILLVSHDTGAVKSICKKCLFLEKGVQVDYGDSSTVIEKYFSFRAADTQKIVNSCGVTSAGTGQRETDNRKDSLFVNNDAFEKKAAFQRVRNGKADFANIQILDESGNPTESIEYDQDVILRMAVEVQEDIDQLSYGYHIRDKNGVDVVYSDSSVENTPLVGVKKGDRYIIDWKFAAPLLQGAYNISCMLSIVRDVNAGVIDICDFVPLAAQFEMASRIGARLYGLVHLKNTVNIEKI